MDGSHAVWGERVCKLARAMKAEQEKIKTEEEKEESKKKKLEDKQKKAGAAKKKVEEVDSKLEDLTVIADASLKKIPAGKPCLENLSAKSKAEVLHVHVTGAGICARCRWTSGCNECDGAHAVWYWLKQGLPAESSSEKHLQWLSDPQASNPLLQPSSS